MAEKKKYNSILISGRKDQTLTYSKYVKDEESGESVKESLDKKVNVTDELTTQQIKDGAITNEKMAADSVGNTNLQDGSVSNEKLEDGSITNEKLAENSITKDKLQDKTIGVEKLDNELRQAIAAATGLPENLVETIQNVDDTLKDHQSQLDDKQSQIDDKQQQITANDEEISLLQTRSTQMEETIKGIAATGGASVASAVTYDNTTSQLTSVNIQGAVDELQGSKIGKTSILQESGDAEDKVMSQKAVSAKLYTEVNTPIEKETKGSCYYHPNGNFVSGDIHFKIDYYPVKAGDKVKVSFVSAAPVAGIAFVAEKGQQKAISFSDVGNTSAIINVNKVVFVPDGANYIAISSKMADDSSAYQNALHAVNELILKKADKSYVDAELGKKFDKESVAQESGDSEELVMSQKAVRNKLYELLSYYDKDNIELYRNTKPITASQIADGYYINHNLVPVELENWHYAYYPVEEGKTYLIKGTVSGNYVANICIASDIGTFSKAIVITQQNHTIRVEMALRIGAGVKYVVFSYNNVSNVFLFEKDNSTKSRLDKHDSEILKKTDKSYVDSELIKKFDKDKVVQESGDAEDKVMSQKAVSAKLYTEVNTPIEKETKGSCYYHPNGNFVSGDIHFKIDYYPVKAGDKVKVSFVSAAPVAGIAFVAEKGQQKAISFSDVGNTSAIINVNKVVFVPDGANYIAISSKMADDSSAYKVIMTNKFDTLEEKINNLNSNKYKGKRLLAIGDSITAQNYWQKRVGELLGMSVRNHCKGGIGILQMVDGDESGDAPSGYDPDNFGIDKIYKLNTKDVENVDVIIIMGFYNNRKIATSTPGIKTDMYPTNDTFIGRLNYAIKRIFEELQKANNNNCRVVVCSPHKYGKYPYIDKTANEDGEDIYNAIKISTDYNSVPCIDLMHNGGINQYNWNLCQKSNSAINSNYIPADGINDGTNKPFNSKEDFPSASENKDKKVTLKEYNGTFTSDGVKWNFDWEPYPWLGDQLHLSQFGGYMLGNYIAAQLLAL